MASKRSPLLRLVAGVILASAVGSVAFLIYLWVSGIRSLGGFTVAG